MSYVNYVQDTAVETQRNPQRRESAVKGNMNNDSGLRRPSLSPSRTPPR